MSTNPLFRPSNSPTKTTRPTKAVNEAPTHVRLTHNTFDNSYFNFKTQRYGHYEPFWWKVCTAGDNEPLSNSHNVRSLPFASPILSPMKLNKDYFQVPMYAIQPHTWDYIFKNPTQGDDVPDDSQNLFPLVSFVSRTSSDPRYITSIFDALKFVVDRIASADTTSFDFLRLLVLEPFFSSGGLLYNLGFKFNPTFKSVDNPSIRLSFDEYFDSVFRSAADFSFTIDFDDPDNPTGFRSVNFTTNYEASSFSDAVVVDLFTALSLLRSHFGNISAFSYDGDPDYQFMSEYDLFSGVDYAVSHTVDDVLNASTVDALDCIRLDTIIAYQYACAQYYVNPRVDFIYNAQLYRDNYIQLVRNAHRDSAAFNETVTLSSFNMNGIPVLYDYFSLHYHWYAMESYFTALFRTDLIDNDSSNGFYRFINFCNPVMYLFSYQDQLRFGDYLVDSRTQALGYGEPGSDVVQVFDDGISVTDMSQKLVLQRFRGAVAHLDNTAEDYLETMFHEQIPPDYHYPKFIVHSEFGINGEEISNTTSDNQGNIVTNLKSGDDTSEFSINISVNSILIGISYVSIPAVYSQIKERAYFHKDRYDMFQPMLQYFGDQGIYNREVSDMIPNPGDVYGYTSRNGEYKQRMSQCSGGFLTVLRSWIFTVDLPSFAGESSMPRLSNSQSPLAIRTFDFEFNRFLSRQTGVSLGTGFHFIMQYNNKNVDNRPMDVNPLPLYPSNSL